MHRPAPDCSAAAGASQLRHAAAGRHARRRPARPLPLCRPRQGVQQARASAVFARNSAHILLRCACPDVALSSLSIRSCIVMQPFTNKQGVFSGTGRAVYEVHKTVLCALCRCKQSCGRCSASWRLSGTSCEHSRPNLKAKPGPACHCRRRRCTGQTRGQSWAWTGDSEALDKAAVAAPAEHAAPAPHAAGPARVPTRSSHTLCLETLPGDVEPREHALLGLMELWLGPVEHAGHLPHHPVLLKHKWSKRVRLNNQGRRWRTRLDKTGLV